ncbi:MAG: hydroxyacylglutathione hydrolase family protein [Phycisphaerae bacterium]|nr:hydroxyacylglutathione hydrolase family protein [Phycisphaerae bacterium]
MIFEQIDIGGDKNFAYLVGDEQTGAIAAVDPGANPGLVQKRAEALGGRIELILATHSHYDHIAGVDVLKGATGAPFAAHASVAGVDRPLEDGDMVEIGSVSIRAIFCPGHCRDSLLLLCNDEKLLVGDELFIGGCGITRSADQARQHYENLHAKLMTLPDHLEVYPGHDYGAKPVSTIGEQKATNPYLLQPDFESFWHLRQNWKVHCREHGIDWG